MKKLKNLVFKLTNFGIRLWKIQEGKAEELEKLLFKLNDFGMKLLGIIIIIIFVTSDFGRALLENISIVIFVVFLLVCLLHIILAIPLVFLCIRKKYLQVKNKNLGTYK